MITVKLTTSPINQMTIEHHPFDITNTSLITLSLCNNTLPLVSQHINTGAIYRSPITMMMMIIVIIIIVVVVIVVVVVI